MNIFQKILVLLFAVLPLNAANANDDISGLWQGKLVISPDTELVIQFNISQDASGSYTAVLNTPDGGTVENVKADSVDFNAGNLKINVTELSGSFEGIFKEGKINGEWKQEGTSFPLTLKPYEKPTLSKEDMDMLLGTWQGKPTLPEGARDGIEVPAYSFQFEMSEQGEFTGTFSIADYGVQEPLSDMGTSDGIFTFKIGKMAKYKGKLTEKEIAGELKFLVDASSPATSLTLSKGEYKAPVYNLNLPNEIKEQLSGKWNGILKMQAMETISMAVEFSFETSENGDFLGFVDMPEEGRSGLPITDENMNDGIRVRSESVRPENGEFSGFADKPEEGASGLPVTDENMNDGIQDRGIRVRSVRVNTPGKGGSGLPINDAHMSDGKLFLAVKSLGGEFTGEISADKLVGDWTQTGGGSTPMTLNRGAYVAPE